MWNSLKRGFTFLSEHRQVLYTLVLMVLVGLGFMLVSQRFLSAWTSNQELLEKRHIGLVQDTMTEFTRVLSARPGELQSIVTKILEENQQITELKVLSPAGTSEYKIVASDTPEEVGRVYVPLESALLFQLKGVNEAQPVLSEMPGVEGREWHVVRAVGDGDGGVEAYVLAVVSMADLDRAASAGVLNAYIWLVAIMAVILLMLFRLARVTDYITLYYKLKKVDLMKDDFVSMAAHELRTPLSVIRGYVDLLPVLDLSEADKANIAKINLAVDQLNSLIGDILDVSKLQEGEMEFKFGEHNLTPIIKEVVESFRPLAHQKELMLELSINQDFQAEVDPTRFRQVLVNLVGNAVKYTERGEVKVSVKREGSQIEIRVSDTGLGISAEDQKHLFEKFFRVQSKETDHIRGTGLGLWISAEIMRRMKGRIVVESIKGKGSDFILYLPERV